MKLGKRFLFSRKYRILTHCTVLSFITKSAQFRALIAIKASFLSWFILNIALKSEHDMTNERPILEMRAKKKSIDLIDEGSIEPGTKTWLDPFFNTMYNNCALLCNRKKGNFHVLFDSHFTHLGCRRLTGPGGPGLPRFGGFQ